MLKRHNQDRPRAPQKTLVIGGGVAGLMAALTLARSGQAVTLLEKDPVTGGKIRTQTVDARTSWQIDCGPTVFTLKPLFDMMFAQIGLDFDRVVQASPVERIARHVWGDAGDNSHATLDLFSDNARSLDAIARFAGTRDAAAFGKLAADAKSVFHDLDHSFMRAEQPSLTRILREARLFGLPMLARANPFRTLWASLSTRFSDPRLAQLFARYATYCGGNPMLTSSTLLLVVHAELSGVWRLKGGMRALADQLTHRLLDAGGDVLTGHDVRQIEINADRVTGVICHNGEHLRADQIIMAGDVSALAGMLEPADRARTPAPVPRGKRGLSAVTLAAEGHSSAPFDFHTVAFSEDYPAEFKALMSGAIPTDPTVYVCADSRGRAERGLTANGSGQTETAEPFFMIANAPADGDQHSYTARETDQWMNALLNKLNRAGLTVSPTSDPVMTTPTDFAARFPGSGGSLYGRAPHGPMASFQRPGVRSRIPGLYLAGGSVHPSAGVPMAALSGFTAAQTLMKDWASTRRHHPVVTPGGTSTR